MVLAPAAPALVGRTQARCTQLARHTRSTLMVHLTLLRVGTQTSTVRDWRRLLGPALGVRVRVSMLPPRQTPSAKAPMLPELVSLAWGAAWVLPRTPRALQAHMATQGALLTVGTVLQRLVRLG